MKYLIVGLGISGVTAAKTIRSLDKDAEIEIIGDEPVHYYPRPKLFKIIEGKINERDIYFYPPSWYLKNNFILRLGINAKKIDTASDTLLLSDGGTVKFDKLLIATGAHSFVPPIPGKELRGVFTLRTLKNAIDIREYANFIGQGSEVAVIGGGVLGLEMAHSLKENGLRPTVIEFGPYLLPRQLDAKGGEILQKKFESEGVNIKVNAKTENIEGKNEANGVRLAGGETVPAKMVLISTGVRSNTELAKNSGLPVNRGILVDNYLRVEEKENIFAAGDVAEHNGRVYGIIPPSLEQAIAAGKNMVSPESIEYRGSIPSNTLKVVGLELASMGDINPPEDEKDYTIVRAEGVGRYRKVVLKNGKLVGIILLGLDGKETIYATKLLKSGADLSNFTEKLRDINFSLKNAV